MYLQNIVTTLFGLILASSASAWNLDLNFNNGQLGAKPEGGSAAFSSASGLGSYSDERIFEGSQSAKIMIEEGDTGYGRWGGVIDFPSKLSKGDEVWFRVYTYFPSGFDYYAYGAGSRLKFLRIGTLSATGSNEGYNDLYIDVKGSENPFKWIFEGEGSWSNVGQPRHLPKFDTWESYEMYIKLDNIPTSEGGEALVRVWKDGELLIEINNKKTLKSATSYANRALVFTYWNGGAPQTQHMWVDDIEVTNETPVKTDTFGNPFIGTEVDNYRSLKPILPSPTMVPE